MAGGPGESGQDLLTAWPSPRGCHLSGPVGRLGWQGDALGGPALLRPPLGTRRQMAAGHHHTGMLKTAPGAKRLLSRS